MLSKELLDGVSISSLTIPACPAETIEVKFLERGDKTIPDVHPQAGALLPFKTSEIVRSALNNGQKLTKDSADKEIFECWINVSDNVIIRPGDTIGIFPRNNPRLVQSLIDQQEWENADNPFELQFSPQCKKKKTLQFIPEKGYTLRKVLTDCVDLSRPPSKLFLLALLKYCTKEETTNLLKLLCAKEKMEIFNKEIMEKRVSTVDLLLQMDIKIPASVLLEHSSRLLPRPYSVINCPAKTPGRIRIAFSWDPLAPGLTTSMLKRIISGQEEEKEIYFYHRLPTTFRLHMFHVDCNLLMIGPGLGVIPYLGFLDFLDTLKADPKVTRLVFTTWRKKGGDDVFLNELQQSKISPELHFAYTREESPKIYVQDLLLQTEVKESIRKLLLDPNSKIYICGEGKQMIPAIEKGLSESADTIKDLKASGRLVIEQWF